MKKKYIILILLIIIILGSFFTYRQYSKNIKLLSAFNKEKTTLKNKLDKIITDYNHLSLDNSVLKKGRDNMLILKDSIEGMNEDSYNLFIKFRKRLNFLEERNKELCEEIETLNSENNALKKERKIALKYLNLYKQKGSKLSEDNSLLTKSNALLKVQLEKAKKIEVMNFKIFPMKKRSNGKYTSTSHYKKTSALKLIMLLKRNPFATSGKRKVYVQIANKQNEPVNNKGNIKLSNGSKVAYSSELNVEYYKDGVNATSLISFPKGTLGEGYFINIYLEGRLVARKTVQF